MFPFSLLPSRAGRHTFRAITVSALPFFVVTAATPTPHLPPNAHLLYAPKGEVVEGTAWLTSSDLERKAFHLQGPATVRFDLSDANLSAGTYRLGLVLRTGTQWDDADGQLRHYRVKLERDRNDALLLTPLERPMPDAYQPVRISGKEGSWANWFGSVAYNQPLHLTGTERVVVQNVENHGGVYALWLQPVTSLNAAHIDLDAKAPLNAFIAGQRPTVNLRLSLASGLPPVQRRLRVEWLDLLTGTTADHFRPLRLAPGEQQTEPLSVSLKPGVYRLTASIVPSEGDSPEVDNPSADRILLAVGPARWAKDLPDDWPLATHVEDAIPPMPGFKWFRYFALWSETNPAPGEYDWEEFDRMFRSVHRVGGRLLVASDGAPLWTSSKPKAGMDWLPNATAHPPDDWTTLRTYLRALVQRYDHPSGTLGALELCNEANTDMRWRGTPRDLVQSARIFQEAAKSANTPVKVIGLAISAGHHIRFVRQQVEAGLLDHVDAVSAHFYEELMTPLDETPINSLPRHVDMLEDPMENAGADLPLLNTESGIHFVPRENDRLVPQSKLNARAEANPEFNPKEPWKIGSHWRSVSERRAAATYVCGTIQLMALGVERSFYFSQYDFLIDGAPSFPWVALARLGAQLEGVDYHQIEKLEAHYPGSAGEHGDPIALAYRLGRPGHKQLIVAWGFLRDTKVGRSKHWQPWLEPAPLRITVDVSGGRFSDLYGRSTNTVTSRDGELEVPCGEEPVFILTGPDV